MEVLMILALGAVGATAFFAVMRGNSQKQDRTERAAQFADAAQRRRQMMAAFVGKHLEGWEQVSSAKINGKPGFVAISPDHLSVRLITYQEHAEEFLPDRDKSIEPQAILSFDVVTPERTKVVTRTDKVPVSVRQKRSTMGRAAAGGILLGPIGAVAGAASSLNGKDKVEYHKAERKETITVKGISSLVLGVKDLETPNFNLEFDPSRLAEEWFYRIQSFKS